MESLIGFVIIIWAKAKVCNHIPEQSLTYHSPAAPPVLSFPSQEPLSNRFQTTSSPSPPPSHPLLHPALFSPWAFANPEPILLHNYSHAHSSSSSPCPIPLTLRISDPWVNPTTCFLLSCTRAAKWTLLKTVTREGRNCLIPSHNQACDLPTVLSCTSRKATLPLSAKTTSHLRAHPINPSLALSENLSHWKRMPSSFFCKTTSLLTPALPSVFLPTSLCKRPEYDVGLCSSCYKPTSPPSSLWKIPRYEHSLVVRKQSVKRAL